MDRRFLLSLAAALGIPVATAEAQFVEPSVRVLLEVPGAGGLRYGLQAIALGDVDGDGVTDLATTFFDGRLDSGIYAVSGASGLGLWVSARDDLLGFRLMPMDWNRDGIGDVVAAKLSDVDGAVVVFSGDDGAVLATLPPTGIDFPESLATGGDFDGDGVEDLLTGANSIDVGQIDVFAAGSTTPFVTVLGDVTGDALGQHFAFLGDADAPPDGRAEIVACDNYPPRVRFRSFRWQASGPVERFDRLLDSPQVFGVAGGKDLDGDGRADFAVATRSGVVLRSGANGDLIRTLAPGTSFGNVELLEDVDGDSRADVVAGAPGDSSGAPNGGKVFLWSGASGALLRTITATTPQRFLGCDVRAFGDLDGDGQRDLLVGATSFGAASGSVFVFSLASEVCALLDFETEDDLVTPLVNGQHLDTEFGELVTLTSTGANAGLAIFDSTPGGPNDPSRPPSSTARASARASPACPCAAGPSRAPGPARARC